MNLNESYDIVAFITESGPDLVQDLYLSLKSTLTTYQTCMSCTYVELTYFISQFFFSQR
jgi:hypothetical protein